MRLKKLSRKMSLQPDLSDEAGRMMEPHEVSMMCNCRNIEACTLERYISDVRIAAAELARLRAWLTMLARAWLEQAGG